MRTVEEIVARIEAVKAEDWLGTQRSDLLACLPWEQAREHLASNDLENGWTVDDDEATLTRARQYLAFAWGKAEGHRGISASRSIDHYHAWLWLTQTDEVYNAWAAVPYPQYGAPMLAAASVILGVPVPADDPMLTRMIAGQQCRETCLEGCDSDGQHGVVTTFEVP